MQLELTSEEVDLILRALYEMLPKQREAYANVHQLWQRFRPEEFLIPQIEAIITKMESSDE